MRAGYGKTEITPPLGVELAGYGYYLKRRATRVDDPLFVRAVALEDRGRTYVVVSCDILGLNRGIVGRVRAALLDKHAIPPSHVLIVSIHTHTAAPAIAHEGCGEVCPEYVETLPGAILAACEDALSDMRRVTSLRFSMGRLDGQYAYNRAAEDGPVDDCARGFLLSRSERAPIELISYACHPVCRGRSTGVSADYPGRVCRMAEEKGLLPVYLNGLCGDIDPLTCEDGARGARIDTFAAAILSALTDEMELPMRVFGGEVADEIRLLPVSREDIESAAERAASRPDAIPGADRVARAWEREMLSKFDDLPSREPISVHYLVLGGVPVAALPFEGFCAIGQKIRDVLGDTRALTLGCADELLGYLPTRDDIARSAYAALESTFLYHRLPVLPGEAERLGRELGARLKEEQAHG